MGVFARALRRAGLPVRMSEGFNPRPRLSLPAPLALGIEGLDEVMELDLAEDLEPEELASRLAPELPDGLALRDAERAPDGQKARVAATTYRVLGELPDGAIERCDASEELPVTRQNGKALDIRPYIRRVSRCDGGCEIEVFVTNAGTARPAELVAALCGQDADLPKRLSLVRTVVSLAPRSTKG